MSTLEDFRKALQAGESDSVEFLASAANPKFVQSICAMANSGGGVIFIGVADSPKDSTNSKKPIVVIWKQNFVMSDRYHIIL